MKVLVIGLGSMGKRRVRNLRALQVSSIAGVDRRQDRRAEAHDKYGIQTFDDAAGAIEAFRPDALVISTPPDQHMNYAYLGYGRGLPCFIEASVVDADRILELHRLTKGNGPVMAPSCTMRYFPGPAKVKELVRANAIGRVLDVNYHTGQYLKDWHPWETIQDFYVSERHQGGCREIVPFELTWLNDIFGEPEPVACLRDRIGELGVDIDDVYHFWLRYPGGILANVTIEVLSRPHATREMRILGTEGEIVFSAHENAVRVASAASKEWVSYSLERGRAEQGYINPEEPYVAEMRDYLAAVEKRDAALFPNSLLHDYRVLETMYALERKGSSPR
jgi:predicted dehydrogenase